MAKVKQWTEEEIQRALEWVERKAKTAKVFRTQAGEVDKVLEALRGAEDVPAKLEEVLTKDAWGRLLTALRRQKHRQTHEDQGQGTSPVEAAEEGELVHFEAWVTPEQAAAIRAFLEEGQPLANGVTVTERDKGEPSRSLPTRLMDAIKRLTGGKPQRVRLATLQAELADVPKAQLNETLLGMEREGMIVLYPLDNPKERQPEDEEANLPNSAGFPRHIIYLSQ